MLNRLIEAKKKFTLDFKYIYPRFYVYKKKRTIKNNLSVLQLF